MKYLEAETLAKVWRRVPVERIAPLVAQIASAAEFLEQHGFVHRDIKPANVMVDPGFRKAMLLDLGVIGPLNDSAPKTNFNPSASAFPEFLGTMRYSPYEFIMRREEDTPDAYRAITFYQLGAVLYDLLTGEQMFQGLEEGDLFEAIQKGPLLPPRLRAGVDPRLVELAQNCLQTDWPKRVNDVKWESFRCDRLTRPPTVVMLYTGGTIGASVNDDSSHQRGLRIIDSPRHELLQRFRQRIVRDYTQLHGDGVDMPFDLVWEILPPERQLLSENADPDTWNAIATAIERICHKYIHGPQQLEQSEQSPGLEACPKLSKIFEEEKESGIGQEEFLRQVQNRYIVGIVVLHGTDTLAYSAAALALSLQNLPCPVVLTGSNQPPNESFILERDLVESVSDAWKNIQRCLLFLHTFGHRLTEVFVCFGETVHHAMNLRKTIDLFPLQQESDLRLIEEPYVYSNQSTQRQYMYRYVDGLYCNNFYPIHGRFPYKLVSQVTEYCHARLSPLVTEKEIHRSTFSSAVRMVMVSPSFLFMDCSQDSTDQDSTELFQKRTQGLKVLVVEGYNSGTFPTREGHPFTSLLKILLRESIPIVLVSRHGLIPSQGSYKTQKVDDQEVPVLRLFSVISETAVPLISLVLHDISEGEWAPKKGEEPEEPLPRRLKLLDAGIRKRLSSSPNILSLVLGSILDESDQRRSLSDEFRQEERAHRKRMDLLFANARGEALPMQSGHSEPSESFSATVTIPLQDFIWHFSEIVRPFELTRSTPDGFSSINEMGFDSGRQLLEGFIFNKPREDKLPLVQQTGEGVQSLIGRVRSFTEAITAALRESGMADVKEKLTVEPPRDPSNFSAGMVSWEIWVQSHGRAVRDDELFAVIGYRDKEAKLFRRLREGCDLTWYEHEYQQHLESPYQELLATSWDARTFPFDWFLLGLFKAVFCGVLRDLVFDPWVQKCDNDALKYVNALRQSVTTTVILASKQILRVRLDYRARPIVALR
jgi:L-asparaginase/Glu-tRNA(Gln) amidotransferase subunit D